MAVVRPRRPPIVPLVALLGLWLWSLLSTGWSDSAASAQVAANRWLLYAGAFAVLWWVLDENRSRATILLTGVAVGALGVAGWMLVRMLGGHGASLFLGTRLNDPLGYINGQAGYLLVGVWPCLALAERRGKPPTPLLAGTALGGIVVLMALGLMTQSRSWGIATAVTCVLTLAVVPGRRRRAAAMLLVALAMVGLYTTLAAVWRQPSAGVPAASTTRHAAVLILLAALAAALLWGAAVGVVERLAPRGSSTRTSARRLASVVLTAIVIVALVGIGVKFTTITHRIKTQYNAFVKLAPAGGGTRFLSGAGDRYDYWRVAVLEFRSEPLRGVGAGDYQPGYYLHRRTTEEIQQPHSIELQTLAELGLVGLVMLAAFIGAVGVGFVRTGRAGVRNPTARTVAVAAGGIFVAWLVQTSVDWLHLIPGLTGIALAAAAALVISQRERAPRLGTRGRVIAVAVAGVIACVGAVSLAPRALSLHSQNAAQNALVERKPRAAISDATRALDYDSNSVDALVLRAAAFARLHAFAPSVADIRHALALEPSNWVTWGLLGDLLARRGERARARSAYKHAIALNPLEPSLHSSIAALGR
jgi:hypothetical protein